MQQNADFQGLLSALTVGNVEFIVVGGVGAVLQGAPITTFDLDIVHHRTEGNVDTLLRELAKLSAEYRTNPHVPLDASVLLGPGHVRLMTSLGPLDLLGQIGDSLGYPLLLPESVELDVGGFHVRVLGLKSLIQVKEFVGRDKDRAILPTLRRTLEESEENAGS